MFITLYVFVSFLNNDINWIVYVSSGDYIHSLFSSEHLPTQRATDLDYPVNHSRACVYKGSICPHSVCSFPYWYIVKVFHVFVILTMLNTMNILEHVSSCTHLQMLLSVICIHVELLGQMQTILIITVVYNYWLHASSRGLSKCLLGFPFVS